MAEFETESHPFAFRNGGGKGILKSLERHVRALETWQVVLLGVGGVLAVDHFIAPKGMSLATKALDKLGVSKHPLPPPPPIPVHALPGPVAKGTFTGANRQAGWNRGMSDYGQYLGDVWQWHAHAGPWHGMYYPNYPWE